MTIWALDHNINHTALKGIIEIINNRLGNEVLPKDPRTFMQTPRNVTIEHLANDEYYWHNGIQHCLEYLFSRISEPKTISLNFNMDGLPLFNSSREKFWPILFNIHEMPYVRPMVIGIYSLKTKETNVNGYLTPMVNELKPILQNGLIINGHNITVKIRCFICDSPARAFIKGMLSSHSRNEYILFFFRNIIMCAYFCLGTANFNNHHGCLKCSTIGEYSYVSFTNVFPRSHCPKRTDAEFREKAYGRHHKEDSPLLQLDIDMIEQFPVGDSLHLLHQGLMKRMLLGWKGILFIVLFYSLLSVRFANFI